MNNMKLGEKFKKVREFNNLTQEYVAFQIGISQQAYSKIESDNTDLTVKMLLKISNVLGVKASNFLDKTIKEIITDI